MPVGRPVETYFHADTRHVLGVTKLLERFSEGYLLRCNENDRSLSEYLGNTQYTHGAPRETLRGTVLEN